MVYGGGSDGDNDGGVGGSGVDYDDWWAERADPVLDSASDSYSELEISVGDSRPSSCPAYTVYWLLLPTDYYPNKCLTNIPKKGLSTLDGTRRRSHRSSAWTGYKGTLQHEASTQKTI